MSQKIINISEYLEENNTPKRLNWIQKFLFSFMLTLFYYYLRPGQTITEPIELLATQLQHRDMHHYVIEQITLNTVVPYTHTKYLFSQYIPVKQDKQLFIQLEGTYSFGFDFKEAIYNEKTGVFTLNQPKLISGWTKSRWLNYQNGYFNKWSLKQVKDIENQMKNRYETTLKEMTYHEFISNPRNSPEALNSRLLWDLKGQIDYYQHCIQKITQGIEYSMDYLMKSTPENDTSSSERQAVLLEGVCLNQEYMF